MADTGVKTENQEVEVKTILQNIETGVKESVQKVEGVSQEVEGLKSRIDQIEVKSQQINTQPKIEVKSNYFDGQRAARLWKADILAQQEKKSRIDAIEQLYGRDKDFVNEVKSLMASGNAGQLIDEAYYQEIIPLLYNALAVTTLGARKVPMPNGNLTIRKMVAGTTAGYVGETKAIKGSQPQFAGMRLASKKLTVKTPFSNDLLRSASSMADQMVRDDMIMQLNIAMDYTALYGAGTEYTPCGIANAAGVNKVTKAAVLDGDSLYTDMIIPIKKANVQLVKPGWIFNPDVFAILYNETFTNGLYKYRDELKSGKFHGYPYKETNQVVTGTDAHGKVDIFFGDYDKFFVGEQMSLEVKTSAEATYLDADGNTQSAFDNDETVVKALSLHDMGLIYGKAFTLGNYYTK
ncbi:phage major capsid protein [Clostridium magnum]|uniref:phage major capsid protein n=1 Tax=Clostridium magnum TaxID=33954 RepID=UPI0009205733|nr:phage major capsid protein [Clostridium magnum]SHJ29335.1 phage major capsid protein, HK97 family [Clostridium magnum DSM 2767]